jgi:hypothetical protein
MLTPGRKQELAEIRRDADRRFANADRCPAAKLVVTYLEVLSAMSKNQLFKDRIDELAWNVEDQAQKGHDLTLETTKRIYAYVDALISKE